MIRALFVFLLPLLVALGNVTMAQEPREVIEIEVDASVDEIWNAFATTDGLRSWTNPLAEVDLKIGGKWKTADSVEHTILCYDPKRMISLQATRLPREFRFAETVKQLWLVYYFSPIHDGKTKITVVGLGYTSTDESTAVRSVFAGTHTFALQDLRNAIESK